MMVLFVFSETHNLLPSHCVVFLISCYFNAINQKWKILIESKKTHLRDNCIAVGLYHEYILAEQVILFWGTSADMSLSLLYLTRKLLPFFKKYTLIKIEMIFETVSKGNHCMCLSVPQR